MLDRDDLENRIKSHRLSDEGTDRIAQMRKHALDWAFAIRQEVPGGREQSLALTKLEEALMWANAGIARNPEFWGSP